jgi:hypothetical protein
MHHRQGALSESLFVYHGVLSEADASGCPPRVLSVGLGCGYNEMIAVAHYLKKCQITFSKSSDFPEQFYLESFEGDKNLREEFRLWLSQPFSQEDLGNSPPLRLSNATPISLSKTLHQTYTRVLEMIAAHFELSPFEFKNKLSQLFGTNKFVLREWLAADTIFSKTFGVIFFDAFSSKSTPSVWSEEFLVNFLKKTASPNCGIATYAATGTLNRALKKSGFTLRDQRGFCGKRESTRAFALTAGVTGDSLAQ